MDSIISFIRRTFSRDIMKDPVAETRAYGWCTRLLHASARQGINEITIEPVGAVLDTRVKVGTEFKQAERIEAKYLPHILIYLKELVGTSTGQTNQQQVGEVRIKFGDKLVMLKATFIPIRGTVHIFLHLDPILR